MESAALAGLGGRAVGVKAIGSVLGNGLTRNGRLKARTHQFAETTRGNVNCYPPYKSKIYKRGLILSLFFSIPDTIGVGLLNAHFGYLNLSKGRPHSGCMCM